MYDSQFSGLGLGHPVLCGIFAMLNDSINVRKYSLVAIFLVFLDQAGAHVIFSKIVQGLIFQIVFRAK